MKIFIFSIINYIAGFHLLPEFTDVEDFSKMAELREAIQAKKAKIEKMVHQFEDLHIPEEIASATDLGPLASKAVSDMIHDTKYS